MSALQRSRLGVARRAVGAGLVAGAAAGFLTALASMLGVALAFGVLAGLSELSPGAPFAAVSTGLFMTGLVFGYGSLATGSIFLPVGAAVGYGYEWYLARRRDASLGK